MSRTGIINDGLTRAGNATPLAFLAAFFPFDLSLAEPPGATPLRVSSRAGAAGNSLTRCSTCCKDSP